MQYPFSYPKGTCLFQAEYIRFFQQVEKIATDFYSLAPCVSDVARYCDGVLRFWELVGEVGGGEVTSVSPNYRYMYTYCNASTIQYDLLEYNTITEWISTQT